MDDLDDLQARVAAAQEKLRLNADDQRKYGLRLNDVVTIVEGSLARQQDEMKRLQDAAVALRLESDAARVAETQAKSLYEAALARLNQLQAQNEQLRNMVLTLLNVIEGREAPSALQAVVQRLESTVHDAPNPKPAPVIAEEVAAPAASQDAAVASLVAEAVEADDLAVAETEAAETEALVDHEELEELAAEDQAPAEEESVLTEAAETEPATVDFDDAAAGAAVAAGDDESPEAASISAEPIAAMEATGADPAVEMTDEAADADIDAESGDVAAAAEDMPEDLDDISMNGNRDFVTDADEMVANETLVDAIVEPETPAETPSKPVAQQDETLVTALLDAEKALIEAGASGVANANSPVAEIIRRISLRTREFSEASGS